MSIAGYLGRQSPERLTSGKELRKLLDEKREPKEEQQREFYKDVEGYDPVLSNHCGL
jgi:hypothetical protein